MTSSTNISAADSSGSVPLAAVSRAEQEYRLRLESFKKRTTDLQSTDRLMSRIRIVAFLAIIGVSCICLGDQTVSWYWLAAPITLFVAVLRIHAPIVQRMNRARAARDFYINSLARLSGDWKQVSDSGQYFADPKHPWSADLDLFGTGSLFQRLNLCRTLPGKRKLAEWLTTVPATDQIELRQRQTDSLHDQLDLREALAVIDDDVDWGTAEHTIQEWLAETVKPFPAWSLWGARLLSFFSFITLILVFGSGLSASAILLMMLLQAPFVYVNRRRIKTIMDHVDAVDKPLRQLAEVTQQFESFPFQEKSLQQLQNRLSVNGVIASSRISELSSQIQWLNNALRNQFFMPLAWMFGLFLLLPHRIERWRQNYGSRVTEWIDTITTLEVLNSIAAFNYEQEGYCRAEISESSVEYTATGIGHPLLTASECICNDVTLTSSQPLMLISGSNMSGKSTLLRSMGINLVLAYCGGRVRAQSLTAYPFQLATAMRVSDSLQEGRSLFFSVVQRLKAVVDLAAKERPVLFLLDEILSGTNSHDRRRGAEAVIRSLVDRHALGIVTTHDLSLTEIVESMDGKAVNMHFEDQVENGQMSFDYKLREGVVQRSNAIELMRMMGLDV